MCVVFIVISSWGLYQEQVWRKWRGRHLLARSIFPLVGTRGTPNCLPCAPSEQDRGHWHGNLKSSPLTQSNANISSKSNCPFTVNQLNSDYINPRYNTQMYCHKTCMFTWHTHTSSNTTKIPNIESHYSTCSGQVKSEQPGLVCGFIWLVATQTVPPQTCGSVCYAVELWGHLTALVFPWHYRLWQCTQT